MAKAASVLTCAVLALSLAGCAAKPAAPVVAVDASRTTVVLLPDEDGNVGAVSVTTPEGSRTVDQAYSFTTVQGTGSRPSELQMMGKERVNAAFQEVLKAQPPKPKSFTLYFILDGTELTEESNALLSTVFAAVHERKPTEITIFGHTDALGPEERNVRLSAERAKAVERILRKRDPGLGRVDLQSFGSREPLVPSAPRAAEPRNRRAEIMIL